MAVLVAAEPRFCALRPGQAGPQTRDERGPVGRETRRVAVLEQAVKHELVEPLHVSKQDMVADPYTKYLPLQVYQRLTHYANNYRGPLPARAPKGA